MFPILYHEHHSLNNDDMSFWFYLANRYPGKILELGCGTGRVLLPLWEAGFDILGLDLDADMLAFLHILAKRIGVNSPKVFQANCAHFHIHTQFRMITMPCNTYSTLSADERVGTLKTVRQHLTPEGVFVFSMPNPELLKKLPVTAEEEVEEVFAHPLDGEPVQVSSSWKRSPVDFTLWWDYDHLLSDGKVQRTHIEIIHSLQNVDDYLDELHQHGMTALQMYGDFDCRPYRKNSQNLIILAGIL